MCLFKKWRKRKVDKQIAQGNNKIKDNREKISEVKVVEAEITNNKSADKVEKLKTRPFNAPKAKVEETKKDNISNQEENNRKYSGKYEVYPEAGNFKYRLKASNGEILAVSLRYSTEKGALSGINTFIKNVEEGQFNIVTDKNNFSQFHLMNASGARAILVGEVYQTVQSANSAVESVKSFYKTDKIDILTTIPASEVREEVIKFDAVEESNKGKYELYKEDNQFFIRLRASNAQILFISQGYASKASAKSGLNTIQKAIQEKSFTVSRDKQNRYQFNLYSSNGQLILAGETYSAKTNGVSAAHSVLKFGLKSPLVEL